MTRLNERSSQETPVRLACIQHGDFEAAQSLIRAGATEPYFGMRESVEALEELTKPYPSLILSVDGRPYRHRTGDLLLVGKPMPKLARRIPRLSWTLWAAQIVHELRRFRPTHVLLRVGGQVGLGVASWSVQHQVPTLVVLSNAVWGESPRIERTNRKLMRVLGDPIFPRVYNYKPTACMSMTDLGLDTQKVFAYEFGGERDPRANPAKQRCDQTDCHLVFAARMVKSKGPFDVVSAVRHLRAMGIPARATLFGKGEVLEEVKRAAADLPGGVVAFPGWVDNRELFDSFLRASFVCVPTHPSFIEGMPMALTEALASRTPVIASNCDVFARSFVDGEGVRLFRAKDARHLAEVVAECFRDPAKYDRLSETTVAAFDRVSAGRSFGEVIRDWASELATLTANREPAACAC